MATTERRSRPAMSSAERRRHHKSQQQRGEWQQPQGSIWQEAQNELLSEDEDYGAAAYNYTANHHSEERSPTRSRPPPTGFIIHPQEAAGKSGDYVFTKLPAPRVLEKSKAKGPDRAAQRQLLQPGSYSKASKEDKVTYSGRSKSGGSAEYMDGVVEDQGASSG